MLMIKVLDFASWILNVLLLSLFLFLAIVSVHTGYYKWGAFYSVVLITSVYIDISKKENK